MSWSIMDSNQSSLIRKACLLFFFSPAATISVFFFFFQAEDGIRDFHVTGVQTCALPIWPVRRSRGAGGAVQDPGPVVTDQPTPARSEERRVGKECRSRWSPYH